MNWAYQSLIKYWDGVVPEGALTPEINRNIEHLFTNVERKIEDGNFKDALEEIFDLIRRANKFFDSEQPWITQTTDEEKCKNTLYQCVQIIANLAVLLAPFLPFSSLVHDRLCLVPLYIQF